MGIYVANKVGRQQDDPATRALSVAELTAAQYNAAAVDADGTAYDTSAAIVNALVAPTAVYAVGNNFPRLAQGTWDFAVDGGDVGATGLGVAIPANSIIVGGIVDVQTTCTSAGDNGTGAIAVATANDIVTAVAIGTGTPWDQGLQAIIPVFTAATMVKTTVEASILFTIAVEAFTAGKFTVSLLYIPTLVDV